MRAARFPWFCVLLTVFFWGAPPEIQAAEFCVNTTSDLSAALLKAQENGEDDTIKVVQGEYSGSFQYTAGEVNSLDVLGGFEPGCEQRVLDPTNTVLNGESGMPVFLFSTTTSGTLLLEGISIVNGYALDGAGLSVITPEGDVYLWDNRFVGNHADYTGGGASICADYANVQRNAFKDNIAADNLEGSGNGGGLYLDSPSEAHLIQNVFEYNSAVTGYGGGVYLVGGVIGGVEANSFLGNSAGQAGGGAALKHMGLLEVSGNYFLGNEASDGGGAYVLDVGDLFLMANTFESNTLQSGYEGGGCVMRGISRGNVSDNRFSRNIATDKGGGAVLEAWESVTLANNLVNENEAGYAAGMYLTDKADGSSADFYVVNNTVVANAAAEDWGGGLFAALHDNASVLNVYNSIFWDNSTPAYGADLVILNDLNKDSVPAVVNLYNNNFDQSQEGGTYLQVPFPIDPSNLDKEDPLFNPAPADFHLDSTLSPCYNTGDNDAPGLPEKDLEGDPRIMGGTVDMGVFEYHEVLSLDLPGSWYVDPPTNAYRMIGIPLLPPNPDVFETLKVFFGGHADPYVWRLFSYTGATYEEIVEPGQSVIDFGQGWWIVSTQPKHLELTGTPLREEFQGPVQAGYQMLACPFLDRSISWSAVIAANPELELGNSIYFWDGTGEYGSPDHIGPGQSAWMWAAAAGTLVIPYNLPMPPPPPSAFPQQSGRSFHDILRQPPPPLPPGATVTLSTPNGGETFMAGKVCVIQWSNRGICPPGFPCVVRLEISTDGGRSYTTIRRHLPSSGSWAWRIPETFSSSKQCRLRITSGVYPNVMDESDGLFAIFSPAAEKR